MKTGFSRVLTFGLVLLLAVSTAQAQRGPSRGGRGGFGFRAAGGALSLLDLLRQEKVQDELGLSPEVREQLSTLSETLRSEMFASFRELRDLSDDERTAKMAEMTASVRTKVQALLTPEQTSRLKQLELQREGPSALARDEIAEQMQLSPEQRESIRAVIEEASSRGQFGRGDQAGSREERQQQREASQRERDRKLLAILTDAQRRQWTALLGEPFNDFEQNPFGRVFRGRDDGPQTVTGSPREPSPPPTEPAVDDPKAPSEETAGTTATSEAVPAEPGEKHLRFNFRFAPWDEVLQWFADEAGFSLMMDLPPPGTFNYYDDRSYTPTEALDLLNGILLTKNFTLLRRGNLLACVRLDQNLPPNLVPRITLAELDERAENELVQVVLQLQNVEVATLSEELKPLLGPQGKLAPLTAANQIVVTDTVANVRKLHDLVSRFDSSEETASSTLRIFPIRYAEPTEVEQIVRNMLGASDNSSRDDRRRGRRSESSNVSVAVDLRTRTLMVRAEPGQLALVEQVLRTIDVGGGGAFGGSGLPPQLEVYALRQSDASSILAVLQTVLAGQTDVRLAADTRQNSVVVLAPPDRQQIVRALVDQMDGTAARVEVIPLRRLDAYTAASAVQNLFGVPGDGSGTQALAKAQPGPDGRSLIVRGTDAEISQIKSLLTSLGETPTTAIDSNQPVRVIPLGSGTSRELIETLREMWPAIRRNPIRVIKSSEEPSARRETSNEPASDAQVAADLTELLDALDSPPDAAAVEDLDEPDIEDRAPGPESADNKTGEAPIIITAGPGSLVIASEDTAALNAIEELIRTLSQQRGAGDNYHVYFLKAADAEQVANTLNQILGSSTTLLTGTSTVTRKIVPDVRTNSLLVEASPADLDRIEALLKTLDADELPETGIARQPRIIYLRYARAATVAAVLRDVYRDDLGTGAGQNGSTGGNNDENNFQSFFARMRSRRSAGRSEQSGGRSRQSAPAKMTLGVDETANLLVIAAPQAVYEEVEAVVTALDEAGRDTQQTVQVIPITGANSSAVQSALGALMGNGTAPAPQQTGASSSRFNGSTARSGSSSGDGGASAFRQMLMQRMSERGGFRGRAGDSDGDSPRGRGDSERSSQRRRGGRGG